MLDRAGAGGRVSDLRQVRLLEQDELRVARHAPRESVGQADCRRVRQNGDVVGAADARCGDGDGRAQHVHVRVALGEHAPRGLGGHRRAARREAAGLLGARPQFADGAELRDGQELVGVGREAEIDHAARLVERHAGCVQRAQAIDCGGKRERQFLGFRAAGIVHDPAIGDRERTAIALLGEGADHARHALGQFAPRRRRRAGRGVAADRVDAGAQVDGVGRQAAALHQIRNELNGLTCRRAQVQVDRDRVERDAVERLLKRIGRRRQSVAVGIERAGKDEGESACAVLEIVQRLLVCRRGVRMIDPLHHRPGLAGRAASDRSRAGGAGVQGLDRDAVVGLRDQPVEGPVPERLLDQADPVGPVSGGKFGGESEVLVHCGIGHPGKMPRMAGSANAGV